MNYHKAQENNNKLSLLVSENFPRKLIIDEQRMKQILINLISNSLKFTQKGSVSVYLGWRPGY
jgi:signal transduction histidine kinase